jgi:hypothetical protein
MHFGENQLSPSSFGISPLPTAPLTALQRGTVRASTSHYGRFTLAMGSSLGFGSNSCHSSPSSDSLSLWHRVENTSPGATRINSPVHSSIGTPSDLTHTCVWLISPLTAHQRTVSGSISLPARGFFSPFPHGTLRYRSLWLFSLGTWSSQLPTGFLVSGGTHGSAAESSLCRLPGSHRLWRPIPGSFD